LLRPLEEAVSRAHDAVESLLSKPGVKGDLAVPASSARTAHLERHFGLFSAVALNVTMLIGSGVFLTIPLMLGKLAGPYALVAWLAAGLLMLADGLVWSELGAALPGSGGSYRYLLEGYGSSRWGRLLAFLFIWQFTISGPLEIATGFIAIAQVSGALDPAFAQFDHDWTFRLVLTQWQGKDLAASMSPARVGSVLLGVLMVVLLYRRINVLGKLTVTFSIGVLGAITWILVEGLSRFDAAVVFDPPPESAGVLWGGGLGPAMLLAMFCYIGYYHVCYIGDEVRAPARTIPRSILLTGLLVCLLFVGLHLAMLSLVPWQEVSEKTENLPADFMRRIHDGWAARLVSLCLIWSSFGSCFAGLLGYSRVPYGAARYGHFFGMFGRVHPVHHIPHMALLWVAGLTFFWSFFDLSIVIEALLTTRILGQFIAQVGALALLRRQPGRHFPFRMWLYPLPCGLALAGWGFLYVTSGGPVIVFSLAVLGLGVPAFLAWAWWTRSWPFATGPDVRQSPESAGPAPAGSNGEIP
jgi:amino acid transporter